MEHGLKCETVMLTNLKKMLLAHLSHCTAVYCAGVVIVDKIMSHCYFVARYACLK